MSYEGDQGLLTEAEVSIEIGRRIQHARTAAGVTQFELATHLDISHQQLSKYEKGRNRLPLRFLIRISQFLETDITSLLPVQKTSARSSGDDDLVAALAALRPEIRERIIDLLNSIADNRHSKRKRTPN